MLNRLNILQQLINFRQNCFFKGG